MNKIKPKKKVSKVLPFEQKDRKVGLIGPISPVEGVMPDPVLGLGLVCIIVFVDFSGKKKIGHVVEAG